MNIKEQNIIVKGKIVFDPIDVTTKHKKQTIWKRTAMVMFNDDMCDFYSWFIKKRYNLILNPPIRKSHISFINDSLKDMGIGLNITNKIEIIKKWDEVKNKWNNKEIEIILNPDVRGDGEHWWLNIPELYRVDLHNIRKELGLQRPYWGLHMSIGYANDKNLEHSKYIVNLLTKYGGNFN